MQETKIIQQHRFQVTKIHVVSLSLRWHVGSFFKRAFARWPFFFSGPEDAENMKWKLFKDFIDTGGHLLIYVSSHYCNYNYYNIEIYEMDEFSLKPKRRIILPVVVFPVFFHSRLPWWWSQATLALWRWDWRRWDRMGNYHQKIEWDLTHP